VDLLLRAVELDWAEAGAADVSGVDEGDVITSENAGWSP
jgi:hypothetical protein